MWQEEEGQEDIPESFIRCALHQGVNFVYRFNYEIHIDLLF